MTIDINMFNTSSPNKSSIPSPTVAPRRWRAAMGAAVAQLAFPVPPKGRFAEALRKRSVPWEPFWYSFLWLFRSPPPKK